MSLDRDVKDMVDVKVSMLNLISKMIESGTNPLAIAAILSSISLQMYKTVLSDSDYNAMVDFISESRDKIQSINYAGNTGSMH